MKSLQSKVILTITLCMCVSLIAVLVVDYFYINRLSSTNTTFAMKFAVDELAVDVDRQMASIEQSANTMNQYAAERIASDPELLASQEGIDSFISEFRSFADYEATTRPGRSRRISC